MESSLSVDKKVDLVNYLLSSSEGSEQDGGDVSDFLDQICGSFRSSDDPLIPVRQSHTSVVPNLLLLLRETLLTHRWTDVARILVSLTKEQQRSNAQPVMEALWQSSCNIFHNSTVAKQHSHHLEKLVNQFKLLVDLKSKEVILEFVFFLMSEGRLQEAHHTIKDIPKFVGLKKKGTERTVMVDHLLVAYEGLIWYMEWLEEKQRLDQLSTQTDGESSHLMNYSSVGAHEQVMKTYADKACTCFAHLKGLKGVWDIFVTKHVKLLEFYSDNEEALDVLQSYSSNNPDNPNSLVFLYNHLRKTNTDTDLQIETLQSLRKLCPSDKLMLDLHRLLKQRGETAELFDITFSLLDYPCNKDLLDIWRVLVEDIRDAARGNERTRLCKALSECWSPRSTWWPVYHFNVPPTDGLGTDLLTYKSAVAHCVLGEGNAFSKYVDNLSLNDEQKETLGAFKTIQPTPADLVTLTKDV